MNYFLRLILKIDINLTSVKENLSIKDAIRAMDNGGIGFICVINNEEKVKGIVTDGDFRRAILNEIDLNEKIITITNQKYSYLREGYLNEQVEKIFQETIVRHIPIIDAEGTLKEIITEENFFGIKNRIKKKTEFLDCEVVIMAGGKGTRLDPFTRILPKPLIPIGDKTILEVIIDKFTNFNIDHFYVSVNHKAKIIKSYFEEIDPVYSITYIDEDKPLGTVGALKQLENKINKEIILTNCDIIIETDYSDLMKHHIKQKNDITIVASLKHYNIPYGICEIENGGNLVKILEKPEYDFLVNTGMYVIDPKVLKYIPENEFFHITDLIEKIKTSHKVSIYPISEKSWADTGEWVEYKKAVQKLNSGNYFDE
jgi:dTDP-glucose pyrophosphorylase